MGLCFYYDDPRLRQYYNNLEPEYQKIFKELYQKPFYGEKSKIDSSINFSNVSATKEVSDG